MLKRLVTVLDAYNSCVCSYRLLYVSPGYVVVVDVVVIDVIDMFGASCNNMYFLFCVAMNAAATDDTMKYAGF